MYSDILPKSVAEHYGVQRRQSKLGKSVVYSLANNEDIAPVGNGNVYGEDIKLQQGDNELVIDDAPIKETQSAEITESSTHEE